MAKLLFYKDDASGSQPVRSSRDESGFAPKKHFLKCVDCRLPITQEEMQVSRAGAPAHTFTNPDGVVFTVGCFMRARGLMPVGAPTGRFSWFKGYRWQVMVCASCQLHLGWRFDNDDDAFYALVADRVC